MSKIHGKKTKVSKTKKTKIATFLTSRGVKASVITQIIFDGMTNADLVQKLRDALRTTTPHE